MTDYISREAAIEQFRKSLDGGYVLTDEAQTTHILQSIPAADVVPVVRCKECLHYEMGVCLKIYDDGAANKDAWQERKPDDFCSRAAKREES